MLNLILMLNEMGKRDKCEACGAFYLSIYHMMSRMELILSCTKIDKPLVVYMFSNIKTSSRIWQNHSFFTP